VPWNRTRVLTESITRVPDLREGTSEEVTVVTIEQTATPAWADDARANEEIEEAFSDQEPLARPDWQTAMSALAPLLDVPGGNRASVVAAFMLGAIACEALGDPDAVGRAVERALGLAEADGILFPLLIQSGPAELAPPREPLTQGETRVLRYLASNLSAREIAGELYLSLNTVKTHQRHVYRKLDVRSRSRAVERARALGLLTPAPRRP